jgi:RNA polymerase sigma-70 factor (family 1)
MKIRADKREKKWIRKLAQGDEEAFRKIYEKHWEGLYLAAYNRLGSSYIAEELVQDLFTDLWAKRSSIHIKSSLGAYLAGALKHRILDHMRHEKVREKYVRHLSQYFVCEQNEVLEWVYTNDLQEQLQLAENQLPPRCYTIFQLSRKHHFSNREIADHLNISPKTVENQITKALRVLRTHLTKVSTLLVLLIWSTF